VKQLSRRIAVTTDGAPVPGSNSVIAGVVRGPQLLEAFHCHAATMITVALCAGTTGRRFLWAV